MKRPRTAFFDFACCEGCQLQVANLGEELLSLLGAVEVVEFREVMSETWSGTYDLAIVEGSVTDGHAAERLRGIRERSRLLVAFGSCATIGGVNGVKNTFGLETIRRHVYGDSYRLFPTDLTRALHQVVKVDYAVTGCPVSRPEFLAVVKAALLGIPYYVPDYPVCVECRQNENVCLFQRGLTCLGPVTRAGCNSWCVNHNNLCYGCRGLVSNPNVKGAQDVLARYNVPLDLVLKKMNLYNACKELD
jgi:coenzyme F420-reducing hydrogenase gamma subunit